MAGSYRHCIGYDGHFDFDGIGNMGDANEACEEMFYAINYLANGDPGLIEEARAAYYELKPVSPLEWPKPDEDEE